MIHFFLTVTKWREGPPGPIQAQSKKIQPYACTCLSSCQCHSRQSKHRGSHHAFVPSLCFEQIIPYAPLNCASHNLYCFYAFLCTEGVARYRGEPALYPYYRDYERFFGRDLPIGIVCYMECVKLYFLHVLFMFESWSDP
jgi:hypothetical protein